MAEKDAPARGTRLPRHWDWSKSQNLRDWVARNEERLRLIDLDEQHDMFCDYFAGAPGEKGRKVDWEATWRNWMRRASSSSTRPRSTSTESTSDRKARETQKLKDLFNNNAREGL